MPGPKPFPWRLLARKRRHVRVRVVTTQRLLTTSCWIFVTDCAVRAGGCHMADSAFRSFCKSSSPCLVRYPMWDCSQ